MSDNNLVNPDLLARAFAANAAMLNKFAAPKQAFVAAGDPSMDPAAAQQQQGGAPPGADPAAAGGDPAAAAGGAPATPAVDPAAIAQQVMSMIQAQGGGGAGGGMGGGMVEPIKPKIDVNVELMQIKKMLAKICDAMQIHIPATDMAVNSQDLTQMAMQQGGQQGAGGGQPQSSIQPIQPIAPAAPGMGGGKTAWDTGSPSGLGDTSNRATAALAIWKARKGVAA